jgi:UDP-3-O-acyl N-acetylglucosamine deacetylase
MRVKQKTIKEEVVLSGRGLQTGKRSVMLLRPASAGEGIVFTRKDIPGSPLMRLAEGLFTEGAKRRTEIGLSGVKLQTLEHFMSALWALGIDNLNVEVNGPELPAMDGSAAGFLTPIKQAGLEEQNRDRKYLKIDRPIHVGDKGRTISVFPSDSFSVSYTIDYPVKCVKKETFTMNLDGEAFEREIAPARTFCMKKEALLLFLSGLGRGANFENTLILGNRGPVGTILRFPNEPVRHKVLDLVGDLYMLGVPVVGNFICEKSGHALNSMVMKEIYLRHENDM